MPWTTRGSSNFKDSFHPKDKKFPWSLSAHSPSEKAVGSWRGRSLIPVFTRSTPMLPSRTFPTLSSLEVTLNKCFSLFTY